MSIQQRQKARRASLPKYAAWVPDETRQWFTSLQDGQGRKDHLLMAKVADLPALKKLLTDNNLASSAQIVLKNLRREQKPIAQFNYFLLAACVTPTAPSPPPPTAEIERALGDISSKAQELAALLEKWQEHIGSANIPSPRDRKQARLDPAGIAGSRLSKQGLRQQPTYASRTPEFLSHLVDEVDLSLMLHTHYNNQSKRHKDAREETYAERNIVIDQLIQQAATFLNQTPRTFLAHLASTLTGRPISASSVAYRAKNIRT